jgi:hypothetical protein
VHQLPRQLTNALSDRPSGREWDLIVVAVRRKVALWLLHGNRSPKGLLCAQLC